ncbi:MMPL family transporter [Gordonia crocea]|uniref:Putative membrane protein, MmpL n=1 Tax=Gordonia crocea TaxID=589162 RepID=A0A7M3SVQ0_9ACTN|nr:MMPL family transporter [Gordonia crocea]GED96724.1 putative membrane protein, MmpL [Gordonia crocea]
MSHQYSPKFERVGRFTARYATWVVLGWFALAAVVNVAWPQLEDVAARKAASPIPANSPAIQSMLTMADKFGERGNLNSVIVVMENPAGMTGEARARYDATVERLSGRPDAVAFVQDVLGDPVVAANPAVRSQVMSEDGKAWILLAGLTGDIGSPKTLASLQVAQDIVHQTFDGSPTKAWVTGPTATVGDLAMTSVADIRVIGAVTFVLISIILLLVFRSVFTALLPMLVMGVSVGVARGVVAGLSEIGLPISTMSATLMVAILAGACVNYSVFLISRYHENLRSGMDPPEALAKASGSMSRVIMAAAATIAIANLAQLTAKLQFLSAAGPAVAISIGVGFLASITMLPAVLALAAHFNLGLAKPDRTGAYWRRIGEMVVARPVQTLVASLVVLALLSGLTAFIHVGYDDRKAQPQDTESALGYATMDKHFPTDTMIPQYVVVESEKDLRTPEGLADLDQLAGRIAQMRTIKRVLGITRPDGRKLTQATLAWQLGMMGEQMAKAGQANPRLLQQIDQLRSVATAMESLSGDAAGADAAGLLASARKMLSTAKSASEQMDAYSGLVRKAGSSAEMIDQLARLSPVLLAVASALDSASTVLIPLLDSPQCRANRECRQLRGQLASVTAMNRDGQLKEIAELTRSLATPAGRGTAKNAIHSLVEQYEQARQMLAQVPAAERQLDRVSEVMAAMSAAGIDLSDTDAMVRQARKMADGAREAMAGMTALAAYLQTVGKAASGDSASGFYLASGLLDNPDFGLLSKAFISTDGKTARYLIQSTINPFSEDAMMLSREMRTVGEAALPNTSLSTAHVSIGGFPSINADLQEMFRRDFTEIVIVTLLVILAVMCLLLRAVLAPLYLLASVLLTYGASIGAGVLVFGVIGGQEIYWAVPAMAFTLVVAVGADYNMLFMARLREQPCAEAKDAIVPAVVGTGSVITSAGLIFAAAMFGMLAGSVSTMVQMGFIIGIGILIDTFIVRTITVPAVVALVGNRSWWPSKK